MNELKGFVKRHFKHFSYFYTHLRYRIFVALGLSLLVGILDGFGLAMFLPLLQMADGDASADPESLGNLSFLMTGMEYLGLSLTISSVLVVIVFFFLLKGIGRFIEAYYKVLVQQYFIQNLRFDNINKLSHYSYKAFVMADVGRIQNTLSGETTRVASAYKSYFMTVQAAILVSVYMFLAFLSNPQFAFLVAIGGGLTNFVYRKIYTRTKEASAKLTRGGHRFQGQLIQMIAFFKYLKATGLIHLYDKKIKQTIQEIEVINKKMGWYGAILTSTREPLVMLVVVGVILIQVKFFAAGLGLIILSLLFLYRSLNYLIQLQTQWNSFLVVSGSLDNMTDFVHELKQNQERAGKLKMEHFEKELELRKAFFSYENTSVLMDINLTIKKNETIAFVGESGSGKTTLVNILSGLMPLNEGEFLIDNQNSSEMNLRTYQKRIGYITQEPVIFSDTIFNNVTFWADDNPENKQRFWEALNRASIVDFVYELPNKEYSLQGNNGITVSGGQKQRLSIARELYKEAEILILDEATSALDSETEKSIQENLEALKGKFTVLIVAHRLSTIRNADRVVLLNKGRIEGIGTFEELRHRSAQFRRMVEMQEL